MANPVIINPTLTLAGQRAAFNAANTGIELQLDAVSFGRDHYDPTGEELALKSPVGNKVPLAGASRPTPYQIRMVSTWREDVGEVPIGEIGFWSGDVLVFVWSKADGSIASYKTDGVSYVLFNDLAFAQVPADSISFTVDPTESVALAALLAHEGAANAHPQYLLRADVAKDSGPLAWLGTAAGTANALDLSLVAKEAKLPDYAPGQRFQFRAKTTNTGAVTAKIAGLGVKSVKKAGDAGLIDVEAGDIKADALYDLNYDGTSFQLGGGVGSGKAFARYSFTASVAQTIFTADHTIGATVVLRDGREVTDFLSDGAKITMRTPCELGTSVEILAFKSFKVADTYTKAELQALLTTASGLPVGAMLPFPRGVVPPGFLEVDGSNFDPLMYPDLAAFLGGSKLPESRGEFLRGWDHGRGVDPGREIGSWQKGTLVTHDSDLSPGLSYMAMGAASGPINTSTAIGGDLYSAQPAGAYQVQQKFSDIASSASLGVTDAYAAITRPRNFAAMWCIKAWNAPVNQGNIDIAALAGQMAAFEATGGATVGAFRNARMSMVAASASATFKAEELIVGSPGSGRTYRITNFNKLVDLRITGIGGMDVLTAPKSGYVAIYAAYNPDTKEAGLFCSNATTAAAPNMYAGSNLPVGFTATALVSVWGTTIDGLLRSGMQTDRYVAFPLTNVLNVNQNVGSPTPIPLSAAVPLNAVAVKGSYGASSNPGSLNIQIGSDSQGNGAQQMTGSSLANLTGNYGIRISEPQKAYYSFSASGGAAGLSIFVSEYEF